MFTLPPPPPAPVADVRSVDVEMEIPDFNAEAIQQVVTGLFGIKLCADKRLLVIQPSFPANWHGQDVALTTSDFDFSCQWSDSLCTWQFESFGMFADSYDSIVVHAPAGTLMAGELADSEGVAILYQTTEIHDAGEQETVTVAADDKTGKKAAKKAAREAAKRAKAESRKKKKSTT